MYVQLCMASAHQHPYSHDFSEQNYSHGVSQQNSLALDKSKGTCMVLAAQCSDM